MGATVVKTNWLAPSEFQQDRGLAALYHLAAIRIGRVVDDPLRRVPCVVILEAKRPEPFGGSFEAGSLRLKLNQVSDSTRIPPCAGEIT